MSEVSDVSDVGGVGEAGDDPEIGYGAAVAELDQILRDLERGDVDVDHLGDQVARAATLIAACRQRIASARLQVERVIGSLDGDAGEIDDE